MRFTDHMLDRSELGHDRRHIVLLQFNVTAHPTSQWTALQLVEAFPFETTPLYLQEGQAY